MTGKDGTRLDKTRQDAATHPHIGHNTTQRNAPRNALHLTAPHPVTTLRSITLHIPQHNITSRHIIPCNITSHHITYNRIISLHAASPAYADAFAYADAHLHLHIDVRILSCIKGRATQGKLPLLWKWTWRLARGAQSQQRLA